MSKLVKCSRTGKEIPLIEGFFVADPSNGSWSFVQESACEIVGDYNIPVSALISTPEAFVDWMAHINEKAWFDAKKFVDFFTKFRKVNQLYNFL